MNKLKTTYIVVETHEAWSEILVEVCKHKNSNICITETLNERINNNTDISNAVKSLMLEIKNLPIKPGEELFVVCGKNTISEEHVIVSMIQRRFEETVKIFIMREDVLTEVPYEINCSLSEFPGEKHYASTNFSSCGGGCGSCGGSCG